LPDARNEQRCFLPVAFKIWGMDASLISEIKQLQAENARLKRMYADIAMQNELVKEALAKK
jgi:putative transposase